MTIKYLSGSGGGGGAVQESEIIRVFANELEDIQTAQKINLQIGGAEHLFNFITNVNGQFKKFRAKRYFKSGTYTLFLVATKSQDSGKIKIRVNSVEVADINLYNSSVSYNTLVKIPNITIVNSGAFVIEIEIYDKDVVAWGYAMYISYIFFELQ